MLLLTRRIRESLWIDELQVRVERLRFSQVQLIVSETGSETPISHILYPNDRIELAAGISLTVILIQPDRVRLGIESPPGSRIRRSEDG